MVTVLSLCKRQRAATSSRILRISQHGSAVRFYSTWPTTSSQQMRQASNGFRRIIEDARQPTLRIRFGVLFEHDQGDEKRQCDQNRAEQKRCPGKDDGITIGVANDGNAFAIGKETE